PCVPLPPPGAAIISSLMHSSSRPGGGPSTVPGINPGRRCCPARPAQRVVLAAQRAAGSLCWRTVAARTHTLSVVGTRARPGRRRKMEFDVVVEIPRGSHNKYEVDHDTGRIRLDRTLFTATQYPADYGFIEDTLGEPASGQPARPRRRARVLPARDPPFLHR